MKWVQANVSLSRPFNAVPLWEALLPRLDAWRPRHWFFMRKAPALRLRFEGRGLDDKVRGFLDDMVAAGTVVAWQPAAYEPETHLFGGREGMEVAHRHFTVDAATAARLELASEDFAAWSAAMLHDLFRRATGDLWEVWEVWKNLERLRNPAPDVDAEAVETARRIVVGEGPQGALADAYRTANQGAADGLRELADAGRLNAGVRALLPFYTVFHWNRFRLHVPQQTRMMAAMQAVLNPRAGMSSSDTGSPTRGSREIPS
ncbi:MAG TPA: thiopeptide-type bacteriocin biosynthesis protein [Candidatus Xenobia bacterium]|jgi:protein-L-isoaspartate(D-aspartate) O-methyltransferase